MQGGKRGSKKGDVIDLAERRFRAKNANPDSNKKSKISSAECVSILGTVAPLDEKTAKKLNLPEELFVGESGTSFTGNPDDNIAPLRSAVLMHDSPPGDLPDFAIDVTSKGSNTFCILADKKRKIVVADAVRNMYSEQGSWDMFFKSVADAINAVKTSEKQGKNVEFVVVNESMIEVREAS
jgi:hypothetical protein